MDIMKGGITQQSLVKINWNFGATSQNRFFRRSLKRLVLRLKFSVPDPLLENHRKRPGTDIH